LGRASHHGELLMLGFEVSETTISRWMRRAPRNPEPAKRWRAFLRNHREVIVAMDFFTVPTLTFNVLYCFFIISHDRKCILHFNVTRHPTSSWIVQQLREAFPYQSTHRFIIFDHDAKYGFRGARCNPCDEDHTGADVDWKSLAEWKWLSAGLEAVVASCSTM
jgi:hypothetical protein